MSLCDDVERRCKILKGHIEACRKATSIRHYARTVLGPADQWLRDELTLLLRVKAGMGPPMPESRRLLYRAIMLIEMSGHLEEIEDFLADARAYLGESDGSA